MILEHEIPVGSRLYFGESARVKREVEHTASAVLNSEGFEEIVTPLFSYHQHQSVDDSSELISLSDDDNFAMTLRADSTIDVVRIVTKRLGNREHKKWFYIQPVYRYPAREQYQVGAEIIGDSDLSGVLKANVALFEKLSMEPLLQISNINIPRIISKELGIELDIFKRIEIHQLLKQDIDWLTSLVYLQSAQEAQAVLPKVPEPIRGELKKLIELSEQTPYKHKVLAPLYYAKMRYYDDLYFRFIDKNTVYARGGRYSDEKIVSVGFSLYIDDVVEHKVSK